MQPGFSNLLFVILTQNTDRISYKEISSEFNQMRKVPDGIVSVGEGQQRQIKSS